MKMNSVILSLFVAIQLTKSAGQVIKCKIVIPAQAYEIMNITSLRAQEIVTIVTPMQAHKRETMSITFLKA